MAVVRPHHLVSSKTAMKSYFATVIAQLTQLFSIRTAAILSLCQRDRHVGNLIYFLRCSTRQFPLAASVAFFSLCWTRTKCGLHRRIRQSLCAHRTTCAIPECRLCASLFRARVTRGPAAKPYCYVTLRWRLVRRYALQVGVLLNYPAALRVRFWRVSRQDCLML